MKSVFGFLVRGFFYGILTSFLLACGKSEIKAKNPSVGATNPSGPSSPTTPTPLPPVEQPPLVNHSSEELILNTETLQLSKPGSPFLVNKIDSPMSASKSRLVKVFAFKAEKKLALNFKAGQQGVGYSKCERPGTPEVATTIKIGGKETASKFADLKILEIDANQELSLTVSVDNSLNCEQLQFEFSVVATEVLVSEDPVPPVVIPPAEGQLIVETKEFLSAGSFGACVDLACFTREQRSSTKKYTNPKKSTEEIIEDHFVISPSLELVCFNRHEIADTSGIMNSICRLILNMALSTNEVNLYRGRDNRSNLVGADIKTPSILEKLCSKWPTINSDEKVEVFVDETTKKEIPRLELICTYDNNQNPKMATFIGVLN